MTNEDIVVEIQKGNKFLISQLWEQTQQFVRMCAEEFHAGDLAEDLIQEGYFGILDAVESFDSTRGIKFLTFAKFHIQQRQRRFMEKARPGIRLPAHMAAKVRKYNRFVSEYVMEHGREPTDQAAAAALNMSDITTVRLAALDPSSLDKPLNEDGNTLGDVEGIAEDSAEDVIDQAFREQLQRDLWQTVEALPDQLAEVVTARFQERKTYAEVAQEKQSTPETIRNRTAKALRILKGNADLKAYYAEIYGKAVSGCGVRRFLDTWTSSTERTAILLAEIRASRAGE